jgi:hypothetical protein
MQIQFQFEELSPRDENGKPIIGMMLYGTATLSSDDPDFDKYAFVVSSIRLDAENAFGSYALSGVGGHKWLWDQITRELYNDSCHIGRAAHEAFREAVDGSSEPVSVPRQRVYSALEVRS